MTSSTLKQRLQYRGGTRPRHAVLVVSPFEEDRILVGQILDGARWSVSGACGCREALELLTAAPGAVVICDFELPDGNWEVILDALALQAHPPSLVVTARLADERLWSQVIHLGGYDVLVKPLAEREVRWTIDSAWRHWDRHRAPDACGHKAAA